MRSTTTTIITEQSTVARRVHDGGGGQASPEPYRPATNHLAVSVGDQEPAEATGLSKDLRGRCFPSGLAPAGSFNAY
jgi:hypothetical protein